MVRTGLILPLLVAIGLGGSACGNLGAPAPRAAQFDLGLIEPLDPPPAAVPYSVEVRAPTWLSSAAMQYRLEYVQPARREAFSESQWVSPPAEMLRQALDRGLTGNGIPSSECRVKIDLDEFVQAFDSAGSSRAVIVARAELLPARSDAVLARENFVIRQLAPTADAPGGVVAHRDAVQQLTQRVAAWLGGLDRNGGQGLNTNGRCRR
jgi:cholesterol transport system auxiliary component